MAELISKELVLDFINKSIDISYKLGENEALARVKAAIEKLRVEYTWVMNTKVTEESENWWVAKLEALSDLKKELGLK